MLQYTGRAIYQESKILRKYLYFFFGLIICGLAVRQTIELFIFSSEEIPERAGVLFVYAGGEGERLRKAVELMEVGVAPLLVVSRGKEPWQGQTEIDKICSRVDTRYIVKCVVAEVDSTVGESREFAMIANKLGVDHVVLVTSNYHLFRAKLWMGRFFSGKISGAGAFAHATIAMYIHEVSGVLHALLQVRRSVA